MKDNPTPTPKPVETTWLKDMIREGETRAAEFDRLTTQAGQHVAVLDLDGICLTLASATHDLNDETRKGDVQDAWMGLFQAQAIVRAIELLRKIETQGKQLADELEKADRADTCQAASKLRNILNPNAR
jgi:hypothetical protein